MRQTAFILQRRMLDEATVAQYLGFPSTSAFRAALPRLEQIGFPRPVPELADTYDRAAVDDWIDAIGQDGLVFSG